MIYQLTENVPISDPEKGAWTKVLMNTANMKLKLTRKAAKLVLLQKLKQKGMGLNEVEEYSRKEARRGIGNAQVKESRRKEVVKVLMKGKVMSAMEELEGTKRQFSRLDSYLRRRWGHHAQVLAQFAAILQPEVRREWEDRRSKHKTKIDHLERRWKASQNRRWPEILEGIRYSDADLKRRAREAGREPEVRQEPLIYGGVRASEEEKSVLSLPPKFTTYGAINMEEIEVEAEVMIAKVKWELHARTDRLNEEQDGKWTKEWEEQQQQEKEVYNMGARTMVFANKRVTDLPTCRRTIPPRSLPISQTLVLNNLKSRLCEVSRGYMSDHCNDKGFIKKSNITEEEALGIRSIQRRVAEREWTVMPSDKSGKLTVNLRDNYLERLKAHTEGDQVVTVEDRGRLEKEMNAHTVQWGRILNLGAKWNASGRHWTRVKSALRTRSCLAPPLYGLPKDHKPLPDGEEHLGPPLRPVCGATESINGALSELLTEILTNMADRVDVEKLHCLSTEEMMAGLTDLNTRTNLMEKPVALSMDVKAMFPNLKREEVARVAAEEFLRSDIEVEVDVVELGLYLAIIYQGRREELEALGLGEVVQKRRHARARTILITTDEVLARREDGSGESRFLEQERRPNKEEERRMFSLALQEAIKAAMSHHVYSLTDQTLLQNDGGPIGLKLSGSVGKVFMVSWSRRFKNSVRRATRAFPSFQLYFHKLYVDDHLQVAEELPPGARFVEGEVVVKEEKVEEDEEVAGDLRTALVMVDIANSVCPFTTMTLEVPSASDSGWMRVLDFQMRIGADKSVEWKFCKKPESSKVFVLNRSAVSGRVKRTMLAQEGIRRLRNTRPDLVEGLRVELMEDFSEMMMISGYPEHYRASVLQAVLTGYSRQVEAAQRGEKPLYRPRQWREEERRRGRSLKGAAWFRPADTVLFLPATPDSVLADRARKVVNQEGKRLGVTVKVVERAGLSLKQQLVKTDLSLGGPCPQGDCTICETNPGEGGSLQHHRSGALYEGACLICPDERGENFTAVYFGESGDSGYVRTGEHRTCVVRKDLGNAFAKHLADEHPEREGDVKAFCFKVMKTFQKSLYRQISEAVKIYGCKATVVLNSRAEWEQPSIDRVMVTRELPEQQQVVRRRGT